MEKKQYIENGIFLLVAFGIPFVTWRVFHAIREAPIHSDPWDEQTEASIHQDEAVAVCHRCFTPQIEHARFCPECGSSIGPYNNMLPYINLFAEGELLRTGTTGNYKVAPLTVIGFLMYALAEYHIFSPVYVYFWYRNLKRISISEENLSEEK